MEPTLALLLRMSVAIVLGFPLMRLLGIKMDWSRRAVQVYLYSGISLAAGMLFSYFAARHISSGLMSLCFGLTPILAGLFAQKIIAEAKFTRVKKAALVLAIAGLATVSSDNISNGAASLYGFVLVLCAVLVFSLSGVLVKSVPIKLHALNTTLGSLLVALPFFLGAWLLATGGQVHYEAWSDKSFYAVLYLGVFASLIGFLAYFFVLQRLEASTVALIVMITPVLSTILGIFINDERFSNMLIIGGSMVIVGLGLFQFGHHLKKLGWFTKAQV